ncbi:MAG: hypothetical protein FD180_3233 [Planctomycetota bacterium]|nr:MAG: hypothetical protein FD180_3233 [Planctomycetota bacterium]
MPATASCDCCHAPSQGTLCDSCGWNSQTSERLCVSCKGPLVLESYLFTREFAGTGGLLIAGVMFVLVWTLGVWPGVAVSCLLWAAAAFALRDKRVARCSQCREQAAYIPGAAPEAEKSAGLRKMTLGFGIAACAAGVLVLSAWGVAKALKRRSKDDPSHAAAGASASSGSEDGEVRYVEKLLAASDLRTRLGAFPQAVQLGDRARPLVPKIVAASRDSDWNVRLAAVRALGKFRPSMGDDIVPALLERMDDAISLVKEDAGAFLMIMPDLTPRQLLAAARKSSQDTRRMHHFADAFLDSVRKSGSDAKPLLQEAAGLKLYYLSMEAEDALKKMK